VAIVENRGGKARTKFVRVLLVEDDSLFKEVLQGMLGMDPGSFELELAGTLSAGIERLIAGGIDLVILGLGLPDSEGLTTLFQMRKQIPRVAIIVLTGSDDEAIASQVLEAGAQDYLSKADLDPKLIRHAMRYAIERQRIESALRASEERYRKLFENANDIIYLQDLKGQILSVNKAGARITGYSLDEIRAAGARAPIAPDFIPLVREMTTRKLTGEPQAKYELELLAKNGRRVRLEVNSTLIYEEGNPVGVQGIARDISERIKSEEKLREQAELLDAARDAIIVMDLEGRVLFWNRAAEKIYGYSASEMLHSRIADRLDAPNELEWKEKWQQIRAVLFEKGEWAGELVNFTKDGRTLTVDCSCSLMRDEAGQAKSMLIIATDVTEKKKLEAQFQKMQRMESLGALASGIAHDLNNWLSPILTSIHTLQQRFTDPNSQKWLSIIRKSAERSRDLVDQVLIFAKGKGGERVVLNTARLVSDVAKIIRETIPRGYTIDIQLGDSLWGVLGDATQLHQVLMNLCLNARDAMPNGGTLTISVSNVLLSEEDVWMVEELSPGNYVQIAVKDTGVGMSQEMIDRIFEPFYTTKKDGLGTGLGLSITLGIVRSHGGIINVTSSVNQGSQFAVLLPGSEIDINESPPTLDAGLPSGNGELVLVVDDEEDIREITVATLESCGYRALGAGSGPDALHLCSERQAEVRLVIADLALPNLSEEFFRNQYLQKIPIIGTSGLRSQEQAEIARRAGIETMLWKPYTAQQLLHAIEKNLS
jgi:PAS domain S-box-containing protein